MQVTPSKPAYARGEQIELSIVLTNRQGIACQVSSVPQGAIMILSLTRDGAPVVPVLTDGSYINGFASFLASHLAPLAPGASLTVRMTSEDSLVVGDRRALITSALGEQDEASQSVWPVDRPGVYSLSVRYVLPPLPDAPADACEASGDVARASFTVKG